MAVQFRNPPNPRLQASLGELGKTLRRMQSQIDRLERSQRMAQLDLASVHNGQIQHWDSTGTLRAIHGLQDDGTFGVNHYNGAAALAPSVPVVQTGVNSLNVTWNGTMSDGSAPLSDFDYIQVHASPSPNFTPSSATQQGVMNQAGTFIAAGLIAGTTYYVTLVAINTSNIASPPSTYTSATPTSVVGAIPPGSIQATQLGFTARTIGGVSISVQSTPPLNPQLGDLWYDGTNNYRLNVWNGISWVPYQFGTNAIAAGSVTAGLVAAGTIIAGVVDGTTITGAKFVATGTSGEILAYNGVPASGNLVLAVSPVAGSDSFGNAYFAGVTTYNGFGAVVNLLSTDHAAFFQYLNHASAVQGSMILSVASTSGSDPVTGSSYTAGLQGIDPVFGDFMTSTGANIHLGIGTVITRSGQISIQQAPSNAQNPYMRVDAPEQTTASHMQMLLQGASPDATQLGQLLIGEVAGAGLLTPVTNAMVEVQGQVTGTSPILQLLAQAAAANSFGIEVTGDGFNRYRIDSNGKINWGPGNATQDLAMLRGAAKSLLIAPVFNPTSATTDTVEVQGPVNALSPGGIGPARMPITQADHSTFTVTAAAATQASKAWTIPASDAGVDTVYRITIWGFGTNGSTLQNLTFGAALNGTVLRSTTVASPGAASGSTRWRATILLHVVTTGSGGTADCEIDGVLSQGSPATTSVPVGGSPSAAAEAINTTVSNTLELTLQWASTTGAPTITSIGSLFERLGT